MAAPAGSAVFFALALLVICLLVLLLLRYYLPLRTTPAYLLVPVFLAVALPASIILIVPIDLASSSGTDTHGSRGIWLPERALLVSWRISYWLTFVLTWAVLPLLGEYADSGYREPKDRLIYSLRSNGRYYAMMLVTGVLGAIYFFVNEGFHYTSLKALVMALAYAWGLILAIYLMGHGLVAMPRRLFRDASISGRLRRLQSQAPRVYDKLTDATDELDQYEYQVAQLKGRKTGTARDFQEWIDDLVDMCSTPESRIPSSTAAALPLSRPSIPQVITDRYLADLTRRLKRAKHKKLRYASEWDHLVHRAIHTQTILDSATSKKLDFGKPPPYAPFYQKLTILTPTLRYHLHTHVIPTLLCVVGTILALASICIIWSELVKSADPKLSLVGLTVIHHPGDARGQIGIGGQVLGGFWLSYMCLAALFSITEVKVWGNRALVRRGTYDESATWYSAQVARLTVPLSYNFVTFMPPAVYRETVFYKFLGVLVDLTPLGKGFSGFFPIFVLLPVLAALFGLYGRVKGALGFGDVMDDGGEEEVGGWREGRALIEREMRAGAHGHPSLGLHTRGDSSPFFDQSRNHSPMPRPREPASTAPDAAPSQAQQSSHRQFGRAGADGSSRRYTDRRPVISTDEEEEDPGFFGDFAHRVRNTIDTTDKPAWLSGIGEAFKRPKWMGGGEESSPGDGGNGGGISRWFGRPAEGRVRL